jgi:hypothetical protein
MTPRIRSVRALRKDMDAEVFPLTPARCQRPRAKRAFALPQLVVLP